MTDEMTEAKTDEINRKLAEAMFPGECYHRITHYSDRFVSHWKCLDCPQTWADAVEPSTGYGGKPHIPDYTTSLDAVAEVEKFVIEKVGILAYGHALWSQLDDTILCTPVPLDTNDDISDNDMQARFVMIAATASAKDRAQACYAALGLKGDER